MESYSWSDSRYEQCYGHDVNFEWICRILNLIPHRIGRLRDAWLATRADRFWTGSSLVVSSLKTPAPVSLALCHESQLAELTRIKEEEEKKQHEPIIVVVVRSHAPGPHAPASVSGSSSSSSSLASSSSPFPSSSSSTAETKKTSSLSCTCLDCIERYRIRAHPCYVEQKLASPASDLVYLLFRFPSWITAKEVASRMALASNIASSMTPMHARREQTIVERDKAVLEDPVMLTRLQKSVASLQRSMDRAGNMVNVFGDRDWDWSKFLRSVAPLGALPLHLSLASTLVPGSSDQSASSSSASLLVSRMTCCAWCGYMPATMFAQGLVSSASSPTMAHVSAPASGVSSSLKRCSYCKTIVYCNADCQRAHWSHHRPECSVPAP